MTKSNPYQIGAPTNQTNNPKTSFFKTNKTLKSTNPNSSKQTQQKSKPINKKFNSNTTTNNQNNSKKSSKFFKKDNNKPFNRDNNKKSFSRQQRKPFHRDNKKSFDKKPFGKNERKPFDRERRPFDKSERRPFDRNEKRPFDRNERRPFDKNQRFSNKKFNQQKENRNIKHQEKQLNQKTSQIDNINKEKVNEKTQKQKVQKIKHNRVIIRNLVFDINVNHLKKLLSPFGQIQDVHIPQNPDGKGSRGFAFIEFKNRNNALKAIKELNGTKFKGRTIVLDESVSKQKYMESKVNEEENANEENKMEAQVKSKVKLEENKKQKLQMESQQQNDQEKLSDQEENDQSSENDNDEKQSHQIKTEEVKKEGSKRQKTESQILQDISSEVFIRNLPITVNEKDLHSFFRKYGKLKFAKIVMNKQTGLSKGSAFIKFEDPLKAKELVEYSRSYEMNLLGKNPNFKVNAGINLQLEGTILKLFPVESRQNISEKLKGREEKDAKREEAKKQQEKKKKPIKKVKTLQKLVEYDPNDKRNLKLALSGINKVTEQMREKDQERFRNHEKQKLEKLKNPNNSVSDTRIVLKYLNKDITEEDIRNLCFQYLDETNHKANDLTYCKLMLESLQTKKSAGFAFVQFKTHQIALAFLQWIENQPSKLMKDPFICQFAIQDSRKLQKLQNRNNTSKSTTKKTEVKKDKSINKNKRNKNKK